MNAEQVYPGSVAKGRVPFWVLPLVIFALGILLRVWDFGSHPAGLNQDEATGAYDAYSVLLYGTDRNGIHHPAMFMNFGPGSEPIPYYFSLPFIVLFGLNPVGIRLFSLLLGILTLAMFPLFMKRMTDRTTGMISLFLLAVFPWHVMAVRWNHEFISLPGFFLFSVCALLQGLEEQVFLPIAGLMFGLTLYTYGPAFLVVPVFLALAWSYISLTCNRRLRKLFLFCITFVPVALPAVLFIVINHWKLPSIVMPFLTIPRVLTSLHQENVTVLFHSLHLFSAMLSNTYTLIEILWEQADHRIMNTVTGVGIAFPFFLPLAILGLIVFFCEWKKRDGLQHGFAFLLFWLFASLVLAICLPPNINRLSIIFLPLLAFFAIAVRFLLRVRFFGVTMLILCALSSARFTYVYFGSYRATIAQEFAYGLMEAIDDASDRTSKQICVTGYVNMPYIFVLLTRKTDPRIFRRTVQYEKSSGEYLKVIAFDRYIFDTAHCLNKGMIGAYVLRRGEAADRKDLKVLRTFGDFAVAEPAAAVPSENRTSL